MNTLRKILTAIAITAAASVHGQGSAGYFDLMGRADKAVAEADFRQADSLLTEALRLEPANPSNYLLVSNLGMIRHYMGNDSMAISTLNMAHDMAPKAVTVLCNRARVFTDLGRTSEARRDYSAALDLDSALVEARFYRGMLALREGDLPTAQEDLTILNSIAPLSRWTHLGNAVVSSASGRTQDAIVSYGKLIADDPQADYYAMRAELYLQTGQLQEASDDIASAIEKSPDDSGLYLLRAMLNMARYRPGDAEADGRKAIELGADPATVRRILKTKDGKR
ncbi:MAG: tetratricopeptide repeat protein [Muribaculaceae bacterium]|nr:tetratricopeptide repeat protein [Muribaculaceae bacterium]